MTKHGTQRNIDQVGRKKRASKAQKESLRRANEARMMLKASKAAERDGRGLEPSISVNRHPDLPAPISREARVFLEETVGYCLERIEKHREGVEIPQPPLIACHHHLTIGSSYTNRLLNKQMDWDRYHDSSYYHGAVGDGAYWEKLVEKKTTIKHDNCSFKILDKHVHPTGISYRYPWLVATPDFIMKMKSKNGDEFYGVVEVKSTESASTFNSNNKDYILQVQASLEVFNLDIAFLVIVLVNNARKDLYNEKVVRITRNVVFDAPEMILDSYAWFVQLIMCKSIAADVPEDIIKGYLKTITNVFHQPLLYTDAIIRLPPRHKCISRGWIFRSKNLVPRWEDNNGALYVMADPEGYRRGYYYKDKGDQSNVWSRINNE